MGIGPTQLKLLVKHLDSLKLSNILQLGRQNLFISSKEMAKIYPTLKKDINLMYHNPVYAEPLFRALGATGYIDSVDYSNVETPTFVADLNIPIKEIIERRYTLVYDGGTSEHCFNPIQVINNAFDLLEINGIAIFNVPCNNLFGHGFWQYSPDFFFQLCEAYNYNMIACYIIEESPFTKYYKVEPTKYRHSFKSSWPCWLFVIIQKTNTQNKAGDIIQSGYDNDTFKNVSTSVLRIWLKPFTYYLRWLEPLYSRLTNRNSKEIKKVCI